MSQIIFRQLFDNETSTYTYLLADAETKEVILIDSVYEQVERDIKIIQDLLGPDAKLKYLAETHVHADHVTGGRQIRTKYFPQALQVYSHVSGVVEEKSGEFLLVKSGDKLYYGKHYLEVIETPGHTNGCLTYVTDDKAMAFTGDCMLIRGCGRTDFQQGSSTKMYQSLRTLYDNLPDSCYVYPAHDYKGHMRSTIDEEKRLNARATSNTTMEQFVQIMNDLKLAKPKKIDISVPANQKGGYA